MIHPLLPALLRKGSLLARLFSGLWLIGCAERPIESTSFSTIAPPAATPAPSAAASAAPSAAKQLNCTSPTDVMLWISPREPQVGSPIVVTAVSQRPIAGKLQILHKEIPQQINTSKSEGALHWSSASLSKAELGSYQVELKGAGKRVCQTIKVSADPKHRDPGLWREVWPLERAWDVSNERLFSVFIERLFDAPLDEQPSWSALHEVLRDSKRNMLHNHLGYDEDTLGTAPDIVPDCADLPYTLRAYFAFKLGLPFAYSSCTRGSRYAPPSCKKFRPSREANKSSRAPVRRIGTYLRVTVANGVHSGSVRTAGDDDRTDVYPVKIDKESLVPGTVFADPYGHILMIARLVPQKGDGKGGIMLAVDGQPDGTVSRRRFWRGNFLFDDDPALGGPGFKRFRPVVSENGKSRGISNAEIVARADYGDFSLEQYQVGVEGFYDRVEDVISPLPIDPQAAVLETIVALEEQVRRRLLSVDNAIDYKSARRASIEMPRGAKIFQTEGPWEDFSTPSRDMRLLIAMDVVTQYPARVLRRRERYATSADVDEAVLKKQLDDLLAAELDKRRLSYKRSDGSSWTISLADVVSRAEGFEMAYNPNDCPEKRWAAPAGRELKTCNSHAPLAQRQQMTKSRSWFSTRKRPGH